VALHHPLDDFTRIAVQHNDPENFVSEWSEGESKVLFTWSVDLNEYFFHQKNNSKLNFFSPSMDICVSYNKERVRSYLLDK